MIAVIPFTSKVWFRLCRVFNLSILLYSFLSLHDCSRFWNHVRTVLYISLLTLGPWVFLDCSPRFMQCQIWKWILNLKLRYFCAYRCSYILPEGLTEKCKISHIEFFFSFQVLFKNLGVDLKEVKPTSLLKDRVREVEGNPDFSNKDVGSSQPPMVNEVKPGMMSALNQVEVPLDVAAPTHAGSHSRIMSQVSASVVLFDLLIILREIIVSLGSVWHVCPSLIWNVVSVQ